MYNRFGHVNRDCPQGASLLCFYYSQVGHKKACYPGLLGGAMLALTPATLRINDGQGQSEGSCGEQSSIAVTD